MLEFVSTMERNKFKRERKKYGKGGKKKYGEEKRNVDISLWMSILSKVMGRICLKFEFQNKI